MKIGMILLALTGTNEVGPKFREGKAGRTGVNAIREVHLDQEFRQKLGRFVLV
jgi:hypothetical protein